MKTTFLNFSAVLLCASLLMITSCKKEENDNESDFTTQSSNLGESDKIGSDADDMSDEAYKTGSISLRGGQDPNSLLSSCATVTRDTVNRTITIDFGSGCTGLDGRTRSGQILISYTGSYFTTGTVRTQTFNNYFVNGNQVTGTRIVTNNGTNTTGNYTWTVQATNMRVTKPDGSYHEWNSTRTREMLAGFGTGSLGDDVYNITGSATGTDSNGGSMTATITNPLRKELACRYIVSGTIEITPSNRPTRTLDYGNGSCDNQATVTRNGITRTITLR
ncbi:MAG: hypothetical protein RIQ89_757 [Bacteroidota bacterium]|jgi:hypothetical protein